MNQQLSQKVYVGLDTHKETIHGTAINQDGEIVASCKFKNGEDALLGFLKDFSIWNTEIAIEACNIWRGCNKILTERGYKVKLANPIRCSQIARDKKTDKKDSEIIAELLRTGFLPEVFIPSERMLELKDLTRHKCYLTREKTRIQNKIKSFLLRVGIEYDRKIWNEIGIKWLKDLRDEKIDAFIRIYGQILIEEKKVLKKIGQISRKTEDMSLLRTIPGVGELGSVMIYTEIADISRFSSPKYLHAYAGYAPGIYQSGSKTRTKKRREVNHWFKWIISQCVGNSILMQNRFQKHYYKICKKKGWKTAKKSTGRKMLTVIWHMLNNKVPYQS